mgnify:CR=1 FL=1
MGAYRLDNGQRVWDQAIASVNPLTVTGNAIFLLSSEDTLTALNRMDGRVYWVTPLPRYKNAEDKKNPYRWYGPALSNGRLYVAGAHGEMRVFSALSGELLATVNIPEGIATAPIAMGDVLYLAGKTAMVYALQ